MRAATIHRYGPPEHVSVAEIPLPPPGRGEVLVRVEAAAVSAGDARLRAAQFPQGFGVLARLAVGLRGPRRPVLGAAFSGVIERIGPDVTGSSPGDEVAGMAGARMGVHAEYAALPAGVLVPKPAEVSHEDAAAALFGGTTALWFLRDRAHVAAGESVLVNGASGSVGSAAVQLAKHLGATVTAVTSGRNAELVGRLGADRIIDYAASPLAGLGERFDVVFDAVGNISRAEGLRMVTPTGRVILAVASLMDTTRARGRVLAGPAPERPDDVAHLLELVRTGSFDPLAEVVGGLDAAVEAHRRIDTGRKVGNLVIRPHLRG